MTPTLAEVRVAIEKYRPSNGTEGFVFMESYCFRCERDRNEDCPILAATMAFDVDDADYPEEWQYKENGYPTCTAFVPEGDPLPSQDDKTGDLFSPPTQREGENNGN